jgi:hypothetical protein
MFVLVENAAEAIASSYVEARIGDRSRCSLPPAPVRRRRASTWSGPRVKVRMKFEGPAGDLFLLATGRATGLAGLSGPGAERIAAAL